MPVEPREVFERYVEVLNRQDWGELDNLLHADYVEEYPQSGERIRGIANIKPLMSNYPGAEAIAGNVANVDVVGGEAEWLVTPAFTVVRVEGSGGRLHRRGSIALPGRLALARRRAPEDARRQDLAQHDVLRAGISRSRMAVAVGGADRAGCRVTSRLTAGSADAAPCRP